MFSCFPVIMATISSHDSLLHSNLSSPDIHFILNVYCFFEGAGSIIYTAFIFTYVCLILLLCLPILNHGLQQRRQNSSAASTSHTDCFTYHICIFEMIGVLGLLVCCLGFYLNIFSFYRFGNCASIFTFYGEEFFHTLTCLEHYLAAVHPLTYLRLKKEKGVRIRNISVGWVWLLCFALTTLFVFKSMSETFYIVDFSFFLLVLSSILFWIFSVLSVLIRPGPGEQGESRKRVDQSKKRAFFTIVCILGALLLRFVSNLIWAIMIFSEKSSTCEFAACFFWLNLPSSLVLPLLFLHRKEKFMFKKNQQTVGLD